MPAVPEPTSSARSPRIALCLSGGGYRAAAYHLGALRRLHENGLLPKVDLISSVSGGSILAAHLAQVLNDKGRSRLSFDDFEEEVAAPLRRQILIHDIRTVPFLKQWLLPWNWFRSGPAAESLARQYARHLTRLQLHELPEGVDFRFCATDLLYGIDWRFEREESGDTKAGRFAGLRTTPLARAVAASSCFPPVFLPMKFALPPGRTTKTGQTAVQLSDGGVYDNLGLRAVWTSATTFLVSDGGGPFEYREGTTPLSRLSRYAAIATHHVDKLNWQWLFARINGWSGDSPSNPIKGATWRIGGASRGSAPFGYSKDVAAGSIAKIRTDMDGFTPSEIRILENHGYAGAARRTEMHLAYLLSDGRPAPALPHPEFADENLVRQALGDSAKRKPLRSLVNTLLDPFSPFEDRLPDRNGAAS